MSEIQEIIEAIRELSKRLRKIETKPGVTFSGNPLIVEEKDGVPSVPAVVAIKVPNGTLTDEGSNTVSLEFTPYEELIIPTEIEEITLPVSMSVSDKQQLIDTSNHYIQPGKVLRFRFEDGTHVHDGRLKFSSFFGGGTLQIIGDPSEPRTLRTTQAVFIDGADIPSGGSAYEGYSLAFEFNSCRVYIASLRVRGSSYITNSGSIFANGNQYVEIIGCYFTAGHSSARSVQIYSSNFSRITANYFSEGYCGVWSRDNSIAMVGDCDSTGTFPQYGCWAQVGVIQQYGSFIKGQTSNHLITNAGRIFPSKFRFSPKSSSESDYHVTLDTSTLSSNQSLLAPDESGTIAIVETAGNVRKVENITKTVGSGKDFATIQEAVNWFKGKIVYSGCKIVVDPGTYTENVDIIGFIAAESEALTIEGDTRELVGGFFAHQCPIFNGGNFGSGTCSLANSGSTITVTGSGSNPDFAAGGLVSGDKVIVTNGSSVNAEYTIDSVSTNTITLTTTAPTVNADGASVLILPNRRIQAASEGTWTVRVFSTSVVLRGITIHTPSAWANINLYAVYEAIATCRNVVTLAGGTGFFATQNSRMICAVVASHVFDRSSPGYRSGFQCSFGSVMTARYSGSFGSLANTRGYTSQQGNPILDARYSVAVGCGEGYGAYDSSALDAHYTYARKGSVGYNAEQFSYVGAQSTSGNCTATTIYSSAHSRRMNEKGGMIDFGANTTAILYPVFLSSPLTSTSWDGDARSTTSKTLIDLSSVFSAPNGIKAVVVRVRVRDSASASGNRYIILSNNATAGSGIEFSTNRITNDVWVERQATIPCNSDGDIYFQCAASGSGTLDVVLEIWGYYL